MSHQKRWLCLIWLLACAASLHAQTALTSLRGTVTDPSGGTVPDATVVIENQASGLHITRTTDTNGAYEFAQIPPGQYKITVKMAGFPAQSKQAELLVNQPATINFAMSVQSANEVVEVSAAAQTLNMTDATIGNSVSNSTIEALPME